MVTITHWVLVWELGSWNQVMPDTDWTVYSSPRSLRSKAPRDQLVSDLGL